MRRVTGGIDVQLYPFFNLGAIRGWVINATSQLLYSWERGLVPIVKEVGWVLELVWMGAESLVPTGS